MSTDARSIIETLLRPNWFCVEAGSFDGTDTEWLARRTNFVLSFEPDPICFKTAYNRLLEAEMIPLKTILLPCALDVVCGITTFHASYPTLGSGSLLEPSGHLSHWPEIPFTSIRALTFPAASLPPPDFLWLDVQGMEGKLLSSCWCLRQAKAIFLEAEHFEMFRGQWTRNELKKLLAPTHSLHPTFDPEGKTSDLLFVRNQ